MNRKTTAAVATKNPSQTITLVCLPVHNELIINLIKKFTLINLPLPFTVTHEISYHLLQNVPKKQFVICILPFSTKKFVCNQKTNCLQSCPNNGNTRNTKNTFLYTSPLLQLLKRFLNKFLLLFISLQIL